MIRAVLIRQSGYGGHRPSFPFAGLRRRRSDVGKSATDTVPGASEEIERSRQGQEPEPFLDQEQTFRYE